MHFVKCIYMEILCSRKESEFNKTFPNSHFDISETVAEQLETKENAKFTDAKYKLVVQRHSNTCGMTCLAIVAAQDYRTAYKESRPYYSDRYGIGCDAIRRYLKKHGIKTAQVQRFKLGEMKLLDFITSKPNVAAIFLSKNKGVRAGHFIVCDGKYIYDPEKGVYLIQEYKTYEFITAAIEVIE